MRKLLYRNNNLASSLCIASPIPHFFHFIALDAFVENVGDRLCVTRWQGIPLVRYILYDQIALYSWKKLKKAILTSDHLDSGDAPLVKILTASSDWLPAPIAVTGRADKCITFAGSKFTESMLDSAVKCEELYEILTGLYRARLLE